MRDVHLIRKLKYIEKARLACCYIEIDTWGNIIVNIIMEMSKYITSKLNHENFHLKRNLLILKNFSPWNILAIWYPLPQCNNT